MEKADPIIEVHNLTHVYAPGTPFKITALDNISLKIERGQFFALVGATGSGKSTLAQHFNGLLAPTSGRVRVCGSDVSDKAARRTLWRKAGLVFQQPEQQLFEETVFDDVAFGPRNMGLSQDEVKGRVRDSLRMVGLNPAEVGSLSPFRLSGGMRRRAAIAGVLALRPELLILDEPTAGLDPQGRRQLMDRVDCFRRDCGISVVLVTHNMEDVARLAGQVAVLHKGRLVLEGSPREVFSRADELRQYGLDVPAPAELMYKIRAVGHSVRTDILTEDEAVDEIERYFRGDPRC